MYTDAQIRGLFGPSEEGMVQRAMPSLCPGVFPSIASALDWLRQRRISLALVTGKGPQTTGSPTGVVKAAAIGRVVAAWGVAPGAVIYVGDAVADMHAAREAGVLPIAAAWAPSAIEAELAATQPHALFTDAAEFEAWLARILEPFSADAPSPARRTSGGSTPAR